MARFHSVIFVLFAGGAGLEAGAQCTGTLSAFPYQEDFEASAAWTSGGSGNDWAWGTPAHATINSAGGGLRSWNVGGLTGAFYNYNEQSWLAGPCFDFSALQYPMVSFKIFWECERTFDGLGFQYSLDQGVTWSNVGAFNEPEDCVTQNWFNTSSITNLNLASPKQGWSGRIGPTAGSCTGGSGSAGWITASHCLVELAGEPSVKFRFIFGAGSTCNSYDGIAIDDVFIGEAPPELPSFDFACFGDGIAIQDLVTCADAFAWNFGDPASGSANTSTLPTVSHTFTGPGSYTLTLSLTYGCLAPQEIQVPLTILDLQFLSVDPTCAGNDGSITPVIIGATAPVAYTWNPGGINTPALTGLGAGTYTVNVVDAGICPTAGSVTLDPPADSPTATFVAADATCNGLSDGSASVAVTGGTPGFIYSWAPQGGSTAIANGLPAGDYTCTITDAASCITSVNVTIDEPDPLILVEQNDTTVCLGEALTLEATVSGGTQGYTVDWAPEGPAISPQVETTYTVTVTDGNGCTTGSAEVLVSVGSVAAPQFSVSDTAGCAPLCVIFTAEASTGELAWNFGDGETGMGGLAIEHCYSLSGVQDVTLTVTDANGCAGSFSIPEAVDVFASPVASFVADPPLTTIKFPEITFRDRSSGATAWSWSFGDPSDSTSADASPVFAYDEVGCYTVWLHVTGASGCADSTSFLLCVEDEFGLYIPTAFTPDNDSYNDFWGAITTVGSPREFELDVFDRWGRVLYHSDDKNQFWDGTANGSQVPVGVYPWRVRMRDSMGTIQERAGHLTLVR